MPVRIGHIAKDTFLNVILASTLVPQGVRGAGLRALGCRLAEQAGVAPRCFFGGTDISIGARSFVNYGCFLDNAGPIVIGDDCGIGMQAMLCTGSHEIGTERSRLGAELAAPVVIKAGSWIGARATVLPGVTIGEGCVIAACALVTSDCESNGLYAGIPARRIRDLQPLESRSAVARELV
jgi:maltose O-acetyltransferase